MQNNRAIVNCRSTLYLAAVAVTAIGLAGCQNTPNYAAVAPSCEPPTGHDLEAGLRQARTELADRCADRFDDYVERLLVMAEGDPGPANKQRFSEFFLYAADRGLLSRRQAQRHYNRYFNVKFVALMGDYNNCSQTCPRRGEVIAQMQAELTDKERGLLRVSRDQEGYYRADRLFQEAELVLEATCAACSARR